jgi:hypothetical protein
MMMMMMMMMMISTIKTKQRGKKRVFGPCLHVKIVADIRSRGAVKLTYIRYKYDLWRSKIGEFLTN